MVFSMCTRPITLPRPGVPAHRWRMYKNIRPSTHCIIVPCGKCLECLKRKQKDIAARCTIEAIARGSMCFLTLTYREATLPLGVTFEKVSKTSGEVVERSYTDSVISFRDKDYFDSFRIYSEELKALPAGSRPRYLAHLLFEDDEFAYYHSLTPSLCRKDFRLWLKSARMAYFREYGKKLDFSYICAGEYGPNTCRPHYHLGLFGLTDFQAYYIAERWRKQYGNYDIKFISAVNPDGSNGFTRCSRYISKYISKGIFECRSVLDLRAEKPRMCCSCRNKSGLGDSFLTPELISYFRCEDLYSGVDIMNPKSVSDLAAYTREVQRRSLVTYGDFSFPLPRKFHQKLWFIYDSFSQCYVASPLRYAMQDFIQDRLFADYQRKFSDSSPGVFGTDSLLFGSDSSCEVDISAAESRDFKKFADFYKKSIY